MEQSDHKFKNLKKQFARFLQHRLNEQQITQAINSSHPKEIPIASPPLTPQTQSVNYTKRLHLYQLDLTKLARGLEQVLTSPKVQKQQFLAIKVTITNKPDSIFLIKFLITNKDRLVVIDISNSERAYKAHFIDQLYAIKKSNNLPNFQCTSLVIGALDG